MSSDPVRIIRAQSRRAVEEFCEFVYRYRGREPHWIPPLRRDQRVLLDRSRHPFHEHAQVEYFLARRNGETLGRIAAIENFAHNIHHHEKVGFFGFLEAVNDGAVFKQLLRAAEVWCRRRGLTALRGPCSFSTNEECGLLVENYDSDPAIMMGYHPPHYREHVEACGYRKAEDLLGYWLGRDIFQDRILRLARAVEKRLGREGLTAETRPVDMHRWREELDRVIQIYNGAWENNWGFVPMTEQEITFIARELKPIINPDLARFVLINGEVGGFVLALPDYNIVLKHLEGRLGPKQIALALALRKQVKQIRLIMMGLLEDYRGKGLDIIMYRDIHDQCLNHGIQEGELSWLLERNAPMVHAAEAMGARPFKRYRIYEKPLA